VIDYRRAKMKTRPNRRVRTFRRSAADWRRLSRDETKNLTSDFQRQWLAYEKFAEFNQERYCNCQLYVYYITLFWQRVQRNFKKQLGRYLF